MAYEPIAAGLTGTNYADSALAPTFNRWSFDVDTFTARQEEDYEEIFDEVGDPSADSVSRPRVILGGDIRMKVGATNVASEPPNVGQYAQIKGGDAIKFRDAAANFWWLRCMASEVSQFINGKIAKCRVEFIYRPVFHDGIIAASITVTDADTTLP